MKALIVESLQYSGNMASYESPPGTLDLNRPRLAAHQKQPLDEILFYYGRSKTLDPCFFKIRKILQFFGGLLQPFDCLCMQAVEFRFPLLPQHLP